MKLKSILFVASLLLASLAVEAKTYHFEIKPLDTKKNCLTESDSLAFLACPIFKGGKIEYYPGGFRAMVADFNSDKAVEKSLEDMKTYFAENPLEGEYKITAGDKEAKRLVGCAVTLLHDTPQHKAAANEAKSWGKALIFALLTVIFGFGALYLFSVKKVKGLARIGGVALGLLALVFGILAVIAIAALAFKYICIILGAVLAVGILLGSLNIVGGSKNKKSGKSSIFEPDKVKGWTVGGTTYVDAQAAREAAERTGSKMIYNG